MGEVDGRQSRVEWSGEGWMVRWSGVEGGMEWGRGRMGMMETGLGCYCMMMMEEREVLVGIGVESH